MNTIDDIRGLIADSVSRDRFIDATEIALAARTRNPSYQLGELISMVVTEAATLPRLR